MPRIGLPGVGWRRDLPDPRDYGLDHPKVRDLLADVAARGDARTPGIQAHAADLRPYFPTVSDQSSCHSSAAHACVALLEYFERRAHGRMDGLSTLFLHQGTQKLLGTRGQSGTDLRTSLKALVRFGLPPEYRWPYELERFNRDPDASLFTYAGDTAFRSICYVRIDFPNMTGQQTLQIVRAVLAAGLPLVFGLVVPSSLSQSPEFLYRPTFDSFQFGQAFTAVGYDDRYLHVSKGALLIRSCWGRSWGDGGYGWLPYSFVENQVAVDFWTILRRDWLTSGEFAQPRGLDSERYCPTVGQDPNS